MSGSFDAFVAANRSYGVSVYDYQSGLIATGAGITALAGRSTDLTSTIVFRASTERDTDFDGVPDDVEFTIGSNPNRPDTDSDGLDDFVEIKQGLDPLGGLGIPVGVVSATSLGGAAEAVAVIGSPDNSPSSQATALLAAGNGGLAVVDVTQATAPRLLAQLALPGTAIDIAADTARRVVAIAGGESGLHLLDLSDRSTPVLTYTVALLGSADSVIVRDGFAHVAHGSRISSIDLNTGEIYRSIDLATSGVQRLADMAIDGNILYAIDASGRLRALNVDGEKLTLRGQINLAAYGGKLFVGGDIVYVGRDDGINGGYSTVDVSNPDQPVLLSGPDINNIAGTAVAANGSGLAVAVGRPGGARGVLDVLNVRDPSNTNAFITRINLPAPPRDVVLANGMAFVADGSGGLQIVNYVGLDTLGTAPTVAITAESDDVDPVTPGVRILEGRSVRVTPTVSDDVQVRNVELLVNGQVVSTDNAFPWELFAQAPTIASGGNTLTLQVRAVDTGGNIGLSNVVTLSVVPDTIPPTVLTSNLGEGAIVGRGFSTVELTFSEAVDPARFTSTAVQWIGPDGQPITSQNIQFRQRGSQVEVTFAANQPVGAYILRIDAAQVKDIAGNALGTGFVDSNFTVKQFTNEWVSPVSGDWNNAANWSAGSVPTAADDVNVRLAPGTRVTISTGDAVAATLTVQGDLALVGGTLTIAGSSSISGAFTQSGGTLAGTGTLTLTGAGSTWSGGTMTGGGTTRIAAGADLTIAGNAIKFLGSRTLTNDGTLVDATTGGRVEFEGAATLNNNGLFDTSAANSVWASFTGATGSLTVNNAGTLRRSAAGSLSLQSTTLNNTGTVRVLAGSIDVSGGTGSIGGSLDIASDAVFVVGAGTRSFDATVLTGTGRLQVSGGTNTFTGSGAGFGGEVQIDGGVLAVDGTLQATKLTLLGSGALSGTGTLTLTGAGSTWSGGTMTGGGTTRIASGTDLTIAGSALKFLGSRNLVNDGSLVDATTGGRVEFEGAATLNNNGLFDTSAANSVWASFTGATGSLTVNNAGTLRRSAAGSLSLQSTSLNNTGTVRVLAGSIDVSGGTGSIGGSLDIASGAAFVVGAGTRSFDATVLTGTGRLQVSGGTNTFTGSGAGFGGEVQIDGGVFAVDGTLQATKLTLLGSGALSGTGTLTLTGAGSTWSGGTMTGGGTTRIASGTDLTIAGSALKFLGSRNLVNDGSLVDATTGGRVEFEGAATLNNNGLFDTSAANSVWASFTGATGSLTVNNAGTLRRSAAGSLSLQSTTLNNTGTVRVLAGSIDVSGGTGSIGGSLDIASDAVFVVGAGTRSFDATVLTGTGRLQVSGGTNTFTGSGAGFGGEVQIDGGVFAVDGALQATKFTLLGSGTLGGAGTLTLTGTGSTWSGGTMTGGGTTRIAAGADLTIAGNAIKFLGSRTLTNDGSLVDATTGGRVEFEGAATLNNNGLFDTSAASSVWASFTGATGSLTVNNAGTLRRSAAGSLSLQSTSLNNTGTVRVLAGSIDVSGGTGSIGGSLDIASGAAFVVGAGTRSFDATVLTGTGRLQVSGGTNTFTGSGAGFGGEVQIDGGVFAVDGALQATKLTLLGSGTLSGTGTLTLTGTGSTWSGGTMTGGGTTRIAAGADLTIGGSAIKFLANRTLVNDGSLVDASPAGGRTELDGAATLLNAGTFDLEADGQWVNLSGSNGSLTFINSGTLRKSGGLNNFDFFNTTLTNSGVVEALSGRIRVNGTVLP